MSGGTSIVALVSTLLAAAQAPPVSSHTIAGALVPLPEQVNGEKVEAEIKAGTLQLLREPTAGYRCLGPISGYDASHNAVDARVECWQSIHFPFRTAAEVGLPDERDVSERQERETPYVMSSGNYWSH